MPVDAAHLLPDGALTGRGVRVPVRRNRRGGVERRDAGDGRGVARLGRPPAGGRGRRGAAAPASRVRRQQVVVRVVDHLLAVPDRRPGRGPSRCDPARSRESSGGRARSAARPRCRRTARRPGWPANRSAAGRRTAAGPKSVTRSPWQQICARMRAGGIDLAGEPVRVELVVVAGQPLEPAGELAAHDVHSAGRHARTDRGRVSRLPHVCTRG